MPALRRRGGADDQPAPCTHTPVTVNDRIIGENMTDVHHLSVSPMTVTLRNTATVLLHVNGPTSRYTSARSLVERALTHDTPYAVQTAETLYEPLSNLPPACRTVMTTSSADLPIFSCMSTGIP